MKHFDVKASLREALSDTDKYHFAHFWRFANRAPGRIKPADSSPFIRQE